MQHFRSGVADEYGAGHEEVGTGSAADETLVRIDAVAALDFDGFDGEAPIQIEAEEAEIVERVAVNLDAPAEWSAQSIYWFTDKASFERYEREGAPALRAEGIAFAESLRDQELGGISFARDFGWATALSGSSQGAEHAADTSTP